MKRTDLTCLWSVIDAMQRRFEAEGLETEVVDVAVTQAMRALFRNSSGPISAFSFGQSLSLGN